MRIDNESFGSTYRRAVERIRAEYLEMPGMRLTLPQVQRLSGMDGPICRLALDELVRAKFLCVGSDGAYLRATSEGRSGRAGRLSA